MGLDVGAILTAEYLTQAQLPSVAQMKEELDRLLPALGDGVGHALDISYHQNGEDGPELDISERLAG